MLRNIPFQLQKRHLETAGYDEPCLRYVGYGCEVGVKVMGYLPVYHRIIIASAGIDSDILVRTVWKRGMRPALLVIIGKPVIQIRGISIRSVKPENGTQRLYLRKFHHKFRSGTVHISTVALTL